MTKGDQDKSGKQEKKRHRKEQKADMSEVWKEV